MKQININEIVEEISKIESEIKGDFEPDKV